MNTHPRLDKFVLAGRRKTDVLDGLALGFVLACVMWALIGAAVYFLT